MAPRVWLASGMAGPAVPRRSARWWVAVLLVALLTGPAWAQGVDPGPTRSGRNTERGWNPGTASQSLAFGARVAVLGMGVVFCGLVFVYLFLLGLRRALERPVIPKPGDGQRPRPPEMSAEVAHAIALALYMDLRAFDDETAQEITIRKITRPFSPWMDSGKTRVLLNNQKIFRK